MKPEELADVIIDYQRKNDLTDNGLAFVSHLPVEKIHSMKIGEDKASIQEVEQIINYMKEH